MTLPKLRHLPFVGLILSFACPSPAAVTDPEGYVTLNLPAGKSGAMAVTMVRGYTWLKPVTAVGPDFIEYAENLPPTLLGSTGSAFIEVRVGLTPGLALTVAGFSGKRVMLQHSPQGLISPGDEVGVRPDWGLGELLAAPQQSGILAGTVHETADTVGILNPTTQEMRVFFFKTDQGWREVGREAEGDRANTPVPFPASLLFTRRGSQSLQWVMVGSVPMPYQGTRTVVVWPGRNLISAPFTSVTRVEDWLEPQGLKAGVSAPRSDRLRLTYADGTTSRVFYRRLGAGWRYVGQPGNAGDMPVEFSQAVEIEREGEQVAFYRFQSVQEPNLARLAAGAGEPVLSVDPELSDFAARKLGWESKAGRTYQIQVLPTGESVWRDHGDPMVAMGDTCQQTCRPLGEGLIRILER